MTYHALRAGLCEQQLHIPRNDLKAKVVDLTGRQVKIIKTALDVTKCRGFYLSPQNAEHAFVKMLGTDVIVLAQGMNRCWDRFVIAKELMHMFDQPLEATDNGEKLDQLLSELGASQNPPSPQAMSETKAFWMAMGALCPEAHRKFAETERQQNKVSDYDIALRFRIPEQYVPLLFHPRYLEIVASFEVTNT
jgi:hypothetical protein